jgi:hypothetical protein
MIAWGEWRIKEIQVVWVVFSCFRGISQGFRIFWGIIKERGTSTYG